LRDPDQFVSILTGDLAGNDGANFQNQSDNSLHVVAAINVGSAVLDGFTVTGGNANGAWLDDSGGGIRLESSNVLVTRCSITGNQAVTGGGGLLIAGVDTDGPAALVLCNLTLNKTDGRGGGLRLARVNGFQMLSCHVTANQAFGGGGVSSEGSVDGGQPHSFVNSLFAVNTASESDAGGALLIIASDDSITNCTIVQNRSGLGGGLFVQVSQINIANSLIWENEDPWGRDDLVAQVALGGLGQASVTHSCAPRIDTALEDGTGIDADMTNVATDPQFLDRLGPDGVRGTGDEDFRLSPGSACADAGDNGRVPADMFDVDGDGDTAERVPLDLAGLLRFTDDPLALNVGVGPNPIVDVGAFEFRPTASAIPTTSNWGLIIMFLVIMTVASSRLRDLRRDHRFSEGYLRGKKTHCVDRQ